MSQYLEILLAIYEVFWKNDLSPTVATARIAPNICWGLSHIGSHCSRSHRNRFIFVGVIAERVQTVFAP